ncbi:hypothetical protein WJX73_005355 [Symbiochloris irregularis]|uniref:RNA ligase domain-containing protein n=1 Tax=Symbiochloris irregularis TaxID=706552 RepID=A0AAW1NYG2_9CHLO
MWCQVRPQSKHSHLAVRLVASRSRQAAFERLGLAHGRQRVSLTPASGRGKDSQSSPTAPGKYPRTPHLPFSPGVAVDDLQCSAADTQVFQGSQVVITEKLDGGNCCIHAGKVFARTHSAEATHASFAPVKALAAAWWEVEPQLALFGENMTAVHSIKYDALRSNFYLFGVLDCQTQEWFSWDDVEATAASLLIPTAPVLYFGTFASSMSIQKWMEAAIRLPSSVGEHAPREGFVIRTSAGMQKGVHR